MILRQRALAAVRSTCSSRTCLVIFLSCFVILNFITPFWFLFQNPDQRRIYVSGECDITGRGDLLLVTGVFYSMLNSLVFAGTND